MIGSRIYIDTDVPNLANVMKDTSNSNKTAKYNSSPAKVQINSKLGNRMPLFVSETNLFYPIWFDPGVLQWPYEGVSCRCKKYIPDTYYKGWDDSIGDDETNCRRRQSALSMAMRGIRFTPTGDKTYVRWP